MTTMTTMTKLKYIYNNNNYIYNIMEYHLCRHCDKKYEEQPHHKKSRKMEDYVKSYLGFCGMKCWDKLSNFQKAQENMIVNIHGTTRKDNHYKL